MARDLAGDKYVLNKLRRLLAEHGTQHLSRVPKPPQPRRATLAEASQELGKPPSTLHDWAKRRRFSRRRRDLAPEKRRKLDQRLAEAKLTIRRIAHLVGVTHSTVVKHRRRQRDQEAQAEDGAAEYFTPQRTQKPQRCPRHGLVNPWPCVACEALAALAKKDRP